LSYKEIANLITNKNPYRKQRDIFPLNEKLLLTETVLASTQAKIQGATEGRRERSESKRTYAVRNRRAGVLPLTEYIYIRYSIYKIEYIHNNNTL
jgi:hypothetical protein